MRCASSVALEYINVFRNPQGREKNWTCPVYASVFNPSAVGQSTIKYREVQFIKACIGQGASLIILGTAVVETAAYVALKMVSRIFRYYTNVPFKIFTELLDSSSFTIVRISKKTWTSNDPIYFLRLREERCPKVCAMLVNIVAVTINFFLGTHMFRNESTHESFARQIIPQWFRNEDKAAIIKQFLPNASEGLIQRHMSSNMIWQDLIRSLQNNPSLLEESLRELEEINNYGRPNQHRDVSVNDYEPISISSQNSVRVSNVSETQAQQANLPFNPNNYQLICPITLECPMDPVQDPTTKDEKKGKDVVVVYERKDILDWLRNNPVSPFTRKPLHVRDLIELNKMSSETQELIRVQQANRS